LSTFHASVLNAAIFEIPGNRRVHFLPYTPGQLQQIVSSRLESMTIFESDALDVLSRKVANIGGDARRVLNLAR
jgi:origin recognition complex subunit 1